MLRVTDMNKQILKQNYNFIDRCLGEYISLAITTHNSNISLKNFIFNYGLFCGFFGFFFCLFDVSWPLQFISEVTFSSVILASKDISLSWMFKIGALCITISMSNCSRNWHHSTVL